MQNMLLMVNMVNIGTDCLGSEVWSTYPTGGIGAYIICKFNKPISIKQVSVQSGTINSEYIKDFTIWGSNDGTTFSKIYSGTHNSNDQLETFILDSYSNQYEYLKFVIDSKYNNNVAIQEILYYGR